MGYNTRHGGAWDRGNADSWYRRARCPHYFKKGTLTSEEVKFEDMTVEEVQEYHAGYDAGENSGDHKEW